MPESSDRSWVRSGVASALAGMSCWIIGLAVIPLDAQLQHGEAQLADLLRGPIRRGSTLQPAWLRWAQCSLVVFSVALTQIVPNGAPGGVDCGCHWLAASRPRPSLHAEPPSGSRPCIPQLHVSTHPWWRLRGAGSGSRSSSPRFPRSCSSQQRCSAFDRPAYPRSGCRGWLGLGGCSRTLHVHSGSERAVCAGRPDWGDRPRHDGAVGHRFGCDVASGVSTLTTTIHRGWCGVCFTGRASIAGSAGPKTDACAGTRDPAAGVRNPSHPLRRDTWITSARTRIGM